MPDEIEMQMPRQMAYDRASVVFSPEGRLFQVEYARKAVQSLSTTTLGVVFKNGVVLAANKIISKLLVSDSPEKVFQIDEHIGAASCGLIADSRTLIDYARVRAQINRITYGEPIEVKVLVKDISDRKQKFTQVAGVRPYGVGLLIAGYDGMPRLFETDPSGAMREWKAHAIGRGSKVAEKILEEEYRDGLSKDKAIELAMKALRAAEPSITAKSVEMGIVEDDKFRLLTKKEIADIMKK